MRIQNPIGPGALVVRAAEQMRQFDVDVRTGTDTSTPAASLSGVLRQRVASSDPDAFVALLHRHPEAVVFFGVRPQGSPKCIDLARRGGLLTGQPISDIVTRVFAPHGLFAPKHHTYVTVQGFVPGPSRRLSDYVLCLNAVAVDLDIGHTGSGDLDDAALTLYQLLDSGIVPPPNIVVHSGRGFWLLWLLQASSTDPLPPQATPDHKRAYKTVYGALCDRLSAFQPDNGCKDLARFMRLPGSYHPECAAPGYRSWFDLRHQDRFTLDGLLSVLDSPLIESVPADPWLTRTCEGVSAAAPTVAQMPTHARAEVVCHRSPLLNQVLGRGWGRLAVPYNVLLGLASDRGGIKTGRRNQWLMLLAHFLVRMIRDERDQDRILAYHNEAHCRPPKRAERVAALLASVRERHAEVRERAKLDPKAENPTGVVSNQEVIERLRITHEEQIRHGFYARQKREPPGKRDAAKTARWERYKEVIALSGGVIPPARRMALLLDLGVRTVQRDYRRIGY